MKKWMILLSAFIMVLALSGCGCEHEWIEADCDTPKTCSLCEETEGEPLGHTWQDATCTSPKTCTVCSLTEGDPLPHIPGDAAVTTDYIHAITTHTLSCSVCEAHLDTTEETISLIEDGLFLFSACDFVDRLNSIYASQGKTNWSASLESGTDDNGQSGYAVRIRCDGIIYSNIFFIFDESVTDAVRDAALAAEGHKVRQIFDSFEATVSYFEIAEQQPGWDALDNDEQADILLDLYGQGDTLFRDILNPVYLACDPFLSNEEIDASVQKCLNETLVFLGTDLIHQENCGKLYVECMNLFSVMGSHIVTISTSTEHWKPTVSDP